MSTLPVASARAALLAVLACAASNLFAAPPDATPAADSAAHSAAPIETQADAHTDAIEEVTISGERAGPGLWKIRKGDHTLYLLGTVSPLPKKLVWRSREVEHVLDRSQALVTGARGSVGINPILWARLIWNARKLVKDPGKSTLGASLPPDLFARYETLRLKYAPDKTEQLVRRPLFAALGLYSDAISRSGLSNGTDVRAKVTKLARARNLKIIEPKIKIDDPLGAMNELMNIPPEAEVACLRTVVDRLEGDLSAMRAQADAWAIGDVDALRKQRMIDQVAEEACLGIVSGPKLSELRRRFETEWFDAAVASLEQNRSSLAVTPMIQFFGPQGLLAKFAARGYEVVEP